MSHPNAIAGSDTARDNVTGADAVMRANERIRVAALVAMLAVVGMAGEVAGDPIAGPQDPPVMQASTLSVGSDTGNAMTAAVWTMQVAGILLFELWVFSRRRESSSKVQHHTAAGLARSQPL